MTDETSEYWNVLEDFGKNWDLDENGRTRGFDREHRLAVVHLAFLEYPSNKLKQNATEVGSFLAQTLELVDEHIKRASGTIIEQSTSGIKILLGLGKKDFLSLEECVSLCSNILEDVRQIADKLIGQGFQAYAASAGLSIGHLSCGFLVNSGKEVFVAVGPEIRLAETYSSIARAWQIGIAPGSEFQLLKDSERWISSGRPNVVESKNSTAGIGEDDFLDFASMETNDDFYFVAIEPREKSRWQSLLPIPKWFSELISATGSEVEEGNIDISGLFDFLDNFVIDAWEFWQSKREGSLRSGSWEEKSKAGSSLRLEAVALSFSGKNILVIEKAGRRIEEKINVLQRFRERELEFSKLLSEQDRRSLILRCIVHDLTSPLAGVQAALSLLTSEKLSDEGRDFLEMSMKQTNRVSMQIREILDVVSAENREFDRELVTESGAPNIVSIANSVVAGLRPLAVLHGVEINLDRQSLITKSELVLAEESSLRRVFYNLIENAIWHSPIDSVIQLNIESKPGKVFVEIRDEGSGVHPALEKSLFKEFTRLNSHINKIGLGLFFCKTCIESWGGEIGYQKVEESGASFWFKVDSLHRPK